jgi:Ni,Fe-hydrogenase III component G
VIPGGPDSATNAIANLKAELDKEKAARIEAQIKAEVLTQAVKDLKISANRYATQIATLEDKINHLEAKVVDGLKEV